jgi:hypothetical protein
MMTIHSKLWIPVLMDLKTQEPKRSKEGQIIIIYVAHPSQKECRAMAAEVMGTGVTWKALSKQGWRLKNMELVADERDIFIREDYSA